MTLGAGFDIFYAEAQEQLEAMETMLMALGEGQNDDETLNALFRSVHTIKGSAGMFDLTALVAFTHVVENVLDRLRDGEIAGTGELISLLLRCKDHMLQLLELSEHNDELPAQLQAQGEQQLAELADYLDSSPTTEQPAVEFLDDDCELGHWHISARFNPDILTEGIDPLAILEFLESSGSIDYCGIITDHLPSDNFDPTQLYLGFEVRYSALTCKADITKAFELAGDKVQLTVLPPSAPLQAYADLIGKAGHAADSVKQLLIDSSDVKAEAINALLKEQVQQAAPPKIPKTPTAPAQSNTSSQSPTVTKAKKYVRVESERLDHLVTLIGELVVHKQRVDMLIEAMDNAPLNEAAYGVTLVTEQVRDAALNLRMTPIGETFTRFKRLVHDTAESLGKAIRLNLLGESTELDRTMVEKITDPLTHLVRNAMDHGIEPIAQREAAGKPGEGELTLEAYHDSGNVVIEVRDDGGGIDPKRIKDKAVEKNLIKADSQLNEREVYELLFHPGFSTAASVTNLSGRGVGMDVVKRNIEELQGTIEIISQIGKGTCFRIRLPLTLAIIDGFHTSSSGTQFIVPQNTIIECLDLNKVDRVKGSDNINLRGELVPFVSTCELFGLPPVDSATQNIIIVQFGNRKAGLLVDTLYGEVQTVVKPLSPIFRSVRGIGGSSVLGSGEIAFILDIPQVIAFAEYNEQLAAATIAGHTHKYHDDHPQRLQ